MGRNAKFYKDLHMKFDGDIAVELDEFVNDVNNNMTHYNTDRTEVMEILIKKCLLDYDDNIDYVREQIIKLRQGR